MNSFRLLFLGVFVLFTIHAKSQRFNLPDNREKFTINFQHIGNLIIVPLEINGSVPLNFVIDTGSPYTIITNLEAINHFQLNKGKPIKISGLGKDTRRLEAYLSKKNTLRLGEIASNSSDIVLLFEQGFDLSTRFGVPIYGIIGYDLLRDFVVEVNYSGSRITFYKHDYFYEKKSRKLKRFEEVPIEIEKGKPYINLGAKINKNPVDLKLLIDSGSWDAIWLFEDQKDKIMVPVIYIDDYLGYGLNGEIHGKKSRIQFLEIGSLKISEPTTSFPDSLSVSGITKKDRNGTLGSEILRRFTTIFDYKNEKVYFKKNRRFKEPFHYNMAGIELYQPFPALPYLEVIYVRENSPAANAGIRKGDAIRYVNGRKVSIFQTNIFDERYSALKTDVIRLNEKKKETISLPEMLELFKTKPGERITLIYTRGNNEIEHTTSFVLEKSI